MVSSVASIDRSAMKKGIDISIECLNPNFASRIAVGNDASAYTTCLMMKNTRTAFKE